MKSPFSYVVLRYMHDVFTREFVNIGVVVYCPKAGFLKMQRVTRMKRVLGLFPGMDRSSVLQTLQFMESRFKAFDKSPQQSLRFETLDAASIAKAILPTDDSSLQWSPPGGGVTEDPEKVLAELFERMVTRHENKHPLVRRTEQDVWKTFEGAFSKQDTNVLPALQDRTLSSGSFEYRFHFTWQPKKGPLHLLLPLSFDLVDSSDIVDKAIGWSGRIHQLRKSAPDFKAFLLLGKPSDKTHKSAYSEAKEVLESDADSERKIVPEEDAALFAKEFSHSVISSN